MAEFDPNVSQPSASATPTADSTPVPATQGTPSAPATITQGQGPAPVQGGTQAPATGAPGEGWVPSHRLRETRESVLREARAYFEEQKRAFEAEKAQLNAKIQALAGFGPQPDPEVEGVRDQFGRLYPGLSKLEQHADRIFQVLDRAGDMESQANHYWSSYGQNATNQLFDAAAADLGELSDEAKRSLHASFVGYVQSSPELVNAYANNPNFAKEYWRAFSSSFIEPVRRVSAAQAHGRTQVPLPQDTPAAPPRVGMPEKPGDLDDRVSRSWTAYNQSKRR